MPLWQRHPAKSWAVLARVYLAGGKRRFFPYIQHYETPSGGSVFSLDFARQDRCCHTEQAQQSSQSLNYRTHKERLREPGSFSLQSRQRRDPVTAFS